MRSTFITVIISLCGVAAFQPCGGTTAAVTAPRAALVCKLSRNNKFKRATANGVAVRGGFGGEPVRKGKTPVRKVDVVLLKDDPVVSKGVAGDIVSVSITQFENQLQRQKIARLAKPAEIESKAKADAAGDEGEPTPEAESS